MQNATPTENLPPTNQARLAFVRQHPQLDDMEKRVFTLYFESLINIDAYRQVTNDLKKLDESEIRETEQRVRTEGWQFSIRHPVLALRKLGIRALCAFHGLSWDDALRLSTQEMLTDNRREYEQKTATFVKGSDNEQFCFNVGHYAFGPIAKQLWNDLANASRREAFPRYTAQEIAKANKSLGHS